MQLLPHSTNNRYRSGIVALSLFLLFAVFLSSNAAEVFAAEMPWNLPLEVNSKNTEVSFEVDSTWVLVKGQVPEVSGKVWLARPEDFASVQGELVFAVRAFDTGNSKRDKKLKKIMAEPQFPNVQFTVLEVQDLCAPDALQPEQSCQATLRGTIMIRETAQELSLPITVKRVGGVFLVSGEATIYWDQFGVEDPSILVAKLDKKVVIKFQIVLQ